MKCSVLIIPLVCGLLLAAAGCGHVDLSPAGDPNRVITGVVDVHMALLPPPDAELVVRLVVPPDMSAAPTSAANDMVIGQRGTHERPEQVIAEQVITSPLNFPVAFRLPAQVDDAQLRRGVNLEARLSWGKELRFRNLESQVVVMPTGNNPEIPPQKIWIDPVR